MNYEEVNGEVIEHLPDERLSNDKEHENNREDEEQVKRYDLWPKRDRDYSYQFAMVSVKVGLEKWAGKAKDALLDELNLSIKEKVFKQVLDPTEIQKKNA